MDTNGSNHETHETHEKNSEPRMDTNGHEWIEPRKIRKTRKTQNHEWTRMDTNGLYHERHERHEKAQNHEWTRMDTKREQMVIEPRMGTNICGQGAITLARMWVALNCGRDAMRHLLTVRPSAKWGIA